MSKYVVLPSIVTEWPGWSCVAGPCMLLILLAGPCTACAAGAAYMQCNTGALASPQEKVDRSNSPSPCDSHPTDTCTKHLQ